ncbi:MAG TPA: hypothetical protein PLO14_11430 [Accumulibacter sp.]|uniref:hypothetical protein n=1 Tax=Accumulibacter sp. TaxID=2053492 RepID=UPI0025D40234|nr:hypothetical protein [Accumulibacter sp.]MCM8597282.1 hypothetical protein [Accumulibacter sp.]MCM8661477.1 hypothetical protein [Accumulibacter sp.]HNC52834.1 hypothetical protein [Accumulibacter sp.]
MKEAWAHRFALAVAIASGTWSLDVQALVTTSGCAHVDQFCTLDELLAPGANMRVNDKLFSNWSASDASTVQLDLSQIQILPLDDQESNPGLRYLAAGGLATAGFDQIDLDLSFAVSELGGSPRISGSSLTLDDFAFGSGNMGGLLKVSTDVWTAAGITLLGEENVFSILAVDAILSDSLTFDPKASILVDTNILVTGEDAMDTVRLDAFTQRFSQAPEPMSLAIFGLALTALWGVRRGASEQFAD